MALFLGNNDAAEVWLHALGGLSSFKASSRFYRTVKLEERSRPECFIGGLAPTLVLISHASMQGHFYWDVSY